MMPNGKGLGDFAGSLCELQDCARDNPPQSCTYNVWLTRPAATIHRRTMVWLALSSARVHTLTNF